MYFGCVGVRVRFVCVRVRVCFWLCGSAGVLGFAGVFWLCGSAGVSNRVPDLGNQNYHFIYIDEENIKFN